MRSIEGNTVSLKVGSPRKIKTLKQRIQERMGIPPCKQLLIYAKKILQEEFKVK